MFCFDQMFNFKAQQQLYNVVMARTVAGYWIGRYLRAQEQRQREDEERRKEEEAILAGIQEARKLKLPKIRTPCSTTPTWWQLELLQKPASSFDVLPNEIFEKILKMLPTQDVLNMTLVYDRAEDIVNASPLLKLHKLGSSQLLKKAAADEEVRALVTRSLYLGEHLSMHFTFVRYLPEHRWHRRSVTTSFFTVGPQDYDFKFEYLLKILWKRFERDHSRHLIIVQTNNDNEAKMFNEGLQKRCFDSIHPSTFPSTEALRRWSEASGKLIVFVSQLPATFDFKDMRVFVTFRAPRDLSDHLELHSFNPRSVYTYVDHSESNFLPLAEVYNRLELASQKPLDAARHITVSRSFFVARARNGSNPVQPLFNL